MALSLLLMEPTEPEQIHFETMSDVNTRPESKFTIAGVVSAWWIDDDVDL